MEHYHNRESEGFHEFLTKKKEKLKHERNLIRVVTMKFFLLLLFLRLPLSMPQAFACGTTLVVIMKPLLPALSGNILYIHSSLQITPFSTFYR